MNNGRQTKRMTAELNSDKKERSLSGNALFSVISYLIIASSF